MSATPLLPRRGLRIREPEPIVIKSNGGPIAYKKAESIVRHMLLMARQWSDSARVAKVAFLEEMRKPAVYMSSVRAGGHLATWRRFSGMRKIEMKNARMVATEFGLIPAKGSKR